MDATRKRLRKLTAAGYLRGVRRDRMSYALFAVGREGKRVLEANGETVTLERRIPTQLDHFIGINDLRIAAENTGRLAYFFAYWELPSIRWPHAIIPDGVMALGDRTFALEFDRGAEGLRFFVRTKMKIYGRGLPGFPLSAVLVIADRAPRTAALAAAIGDRYGSTFFGTLDSIRDRGFLAPVFIREPKGIAVSAL